MTAIQLTDLVKSFGEVTALNNLSLTIEEGEFFGLLGPNGAGKTTTMSVLTGQLVPDSGTACVLGHTPSEEPLAVRTEMGILPEKESPFSFLTPREYFEFVGSVRGIDTDTLDARIDEWADRLNYHEKLNTQCADLSRGQQQKVMITQAFLHEPPLVLIDEPLANLDPIMQETVKDYLREYNASGNTLILTTHHIDVAAELCDRVGVVTDGQLVRTVDIDASADDDLLDVFRTTVNASEATSAVPDVDATADSAGEAA